MDHTTLIALASLSANLKRSRLHRLDAQILSNGTHMGGILNSETTVGFGKATKAEEWVSTVSLKIVGYPKGTTKDDADHVTPVFSVEATVKGVYSWQKIPPKEVLNDQDLAHALGRPLYAVVASECRAAAAKMGFHGVKPAEDLPRAGEGEAIPLTENDLHMIKSGLVVPPKSKVGAPRKKVLKRLTSPKAK